MLDYNSLKGYQENLAIYLESVQETLPIKALRKIIRIISAVFLHPRKVRPVFSERLVEYPLFYHYLSLEPGQHILDFGCVESLLPMQLCSLGYRVTGMDFRPYPFCHENFNFIQGDILQWEPPADYFDAVVSISVIEHVGLSGYGDPKENRGDKIAVQKLFQSLKPGGRLYLTVPAGKATTKGGWYKVYDTAAIRELVPGIETLRFFYKPDRYSTWREGTSAELDVLEYDNYGAMAFAQGVVFVVARKE